MFLRAGQRIQIVGKIANDEDIEQSFYLLAQIVDAQSNLTVSVRFSSGTLFPSQTASPLVLWMPESEGTYIVELFLWDSLDNPIPLIQKQTATVDVVP